MNCGYEITAKIIVSLDTDDSFVLHDGVALFYYHHRVVRNYIVIKCLVKPSVGQTLYFWYSRSIEHSNSSSASTEIKYIF